MPLTTPPVATAQMYARNKTTGAAYLVGPPASSEVEVDGIEPTGDWELWVDTSDTGPLPPAGDDDYLTSAGGTLTGPLVLAADPVAPLEAATKQYVDGGHDTAFALEAGWVDVPGVVAAGAFKQGRMVAINGCLLSSGFAVVAGTRYLVATVGVGFRPTAASVPFPAVWNDPGGDQIAVGYGQIEPDGKIVVASSLAFTMGSGDSVTFNATLIVD